MLDHEQDYFIFEGDDEKCLTIIAVGASEFTITEEIKKGLSYKGYVIIDIEHVYRKAETGDKIYMPLRKV